MDQDSEYLYVASVISEDVTENKLYEPFTPQDYRYGSAFSVKMQSYKGWDSGLPDATPGDDYDGIIIELDPSTGLLTSRFFRVKSQPDRDERIYGACKPDGDQNDFYIVGMTTGNLLSTDAR